MCSALLHEQHTRARTHAHTHEHTRTTSFSLFLSLFLCRDALSLSPIARTPPLAAAKSSPARTPSSLAPSRPRPRPAPRAQRANGWDPVWATAAPRGCPSRTAARRGPRSRGAVPCIGLAAGARIVQAPGLPPRAGAGRLRGGAAKWPRTRSAICGSRSAQAPGTCTWHSRPLRVQGHLGKSNFFFRPSRTSLQTHLPRPDTWSEHSTASRPAQDNGVAMWR
jgi:hypothetical protein